MPRSNDPPYPPPDEPSTDSSTEPHTLPGRGCEEVLDRLELYLDGLDGSDGSDEGLPGLTADERTLAEDHLTRCPACARELGRAQRIRDGLRALPEVPFDLPVAGEGKHRAETPGKLLPGRWTRWSVPLAAAAVLVLAVVSAVVWRSSQPATTVPEVTAEELARAELEARYALARLAEVTRKTQDEITDEILARHVVAPVRRELFRTLGVPSRFDSKPRSREPSSL